MVSDQLRTAISDTLVALNRKRSFVPDLVFAGTNWTKDNENVLYVLNSRGEKIGEYSKHDCYDNIDNNGNRVIEDLNNEWKSNDFFGLPGIGFVFPVICKDAMIVDGPADLYSKAFWPFLPGHSIIHKPHSVQSNSLTNI